MTREERLEKIRNQHMLTEAEGVASCRDDIVKYLKREARNIGVVYSHVVDSIRHDTMELAIVRCVNGVCNFLGLEEQPEEYLEKDIEALKKFKQSIGIYEFLYQRLIVSVTDDNWHDIHVLAEFMGNKFLETDDYYTRVIESIEVSYQGIMCVAGGEDETSVFREVFDEALDSILAKGKEKVKVGEKYDKGPTGRKN